jgi:NifU-like protein involved in Fe-S cluster formation
MSADPYSALVRRLFRMPQHCGSIAQGPHTLLETQGVRVQLSAGLASDRLAALRFLVWGCPHLIAAAEAFCDQYESRRIDELETFRATDLMQTLAVPVEKTGRILVLEDAVQALWRAARDLAEKA